MSMEDTQKYLKRIKTLDDEGEDDKTTVQYDSDLNQTAYQEFWSDIRQIKSTRNSRSVNRRKS